MGTCTERLVPTCTERRRSSKVEVSLSIGYSPPDPLSP